jgi:hypothetical protein
MDDARSRGGAGSKASPQRGVPAKVAARQHVKGWFLAPVRMPEEFERTDLLVQPGVGVGGRAPQTTAQTGGLRPIEPASVDAGLG